MKISPIKQRDASACGPTCVEIALKYFEVPHTLKAIHTATGYKKGEGIYNYQVVDALKAFGLKTKVVTNTSWEMLEKLNTAENVIILSWMLEGYIGHLSVVEKVDAKHIYLAEPTTGKVMKIEKIKFLRLWLDYEAQKEVPWYPETKANIQLRWMVVASKK